MKLKRIYSIDTQLYKITGVEKVMLDVHHALKDVYQAKIVGTISFDKVRKEHGISKEEYIKFSNPFIFYNSIVVVHERKLLILFWILNNLLFQKIKIIYVHHSLLYNHKFITKLPKTIVAIADKGIENLVGYFKAPKENIHKIYNCVVDSNKKKHPDKHLDKVTLLLPGRINNFKQQFEIVRQLKGKLDKRILIRFAGDGERLDELKNICSDDPNFEVLGYRNDIISLLEETDYIFLFSTQEGLSITLIEGTMVGMPIVCNSVGGNLEICHDGKNGWVLNDWDALIKTLNNLPNVSQEDYRRMCNESRKIYEENFTFDIFKEKYLKLLQYICHNQ